MPADRVWMMWQHPDKSPSIVACSCPTVVTVGFLAKRHRETDEPRNVCWDGDERKSEKLQWREFEMTRSTTTPGASARGLDAQGARPPDPLPPTPQCLFAPDAKPGPEAVPATSLDTDQIFEVLISAPLNSDEFEAALDRLFADDSATTAAHTPKTPSPAGCTSDGLGAQDASSVRQGHRVSLCPKSHST